MVLLEEKKRVADRGREEFPAVVYGLSVTSRGLPDTRSSAGEGSPSFPNYFYQALH